MEELSPEAEHDIRQSVRAICAKFPDEYWSHADTHHEFPWEFYRAMADEGWLGICTPEEYGGGGAGVQAAAIFMEEVAGNGGALNAATTVQVALFGLEPIVKHGSEEQKRRFLPEAVEGRLQVCFAVTEPDAGTDTTSITTTARKVEGGYIVNGRKVFISRALEADRMLLITRTSPRAEGAKPTDGMTLFFAEMDHEHVQINPIPKLGRNAIATNELVIDDLFIPDEDRVGEEGRGFRYLLSGLNAERIIVAAVCLGIGRAALRKTVEYAKQRTVFGRPIGQNQGVQFPLADSLAKLDAAELLVRQAAKLYDNGEPCGKEANEAKYLASEWAFEACDRAIQFHGGYGYTTEYHVERYWRDVRIERIAPISNELVLAFLGSNVLGLPRSY
ncbi:acyl-CoA dehydrogenase family protein [Microbacterium sp. CPCC 204701]|uniref:acyl-CoA dehydrogenase family protein n=1 Tax=Microbacterium sp. CPCC 204701 TaxID=2493084 RepID=UPI000FDBB600|nr:acyl-CoA dehydrogenase family protein [Microbacterium sp. CPCC 204701]